ncbi:hypothetical protein Tco_1256531 [Tanacetum coccineum]
MINQCLTGKTSRYDRPRYPVLQMLWGIITSTNVDFAKLMWDEFVQAIQTFLTDKANLGSPTKKGRKDKPHVIPYCRFTKLIICHLGRIHNIHQRSTSPFHLAEEDFRLGNLKFVPKGEFDEHDQKVAAKKEGKKKTASTKQPKSKSATEKSSKPAPAAKPKPAKEKPSKPSTAKPPNPKPAKPTPLQRPTRPEQEGEEYDMEHAIQMSLESFQAQGHVHVGGVAIQEPVAEAIRPLPVVEGKDKAIVTEEQVAQSVLALHTLKRRSTTDQFIFQRRTPATEEASTRPSTQPQDDTSANIVCDSPSSTDAETGAGSDKINSGGDTELIGPELVQETTENIFQIKERLKTARSCQKSYADKRRKPLEFKVGDRVLLKVSPWKGMVRFGKKRKLAPRYVGSFEIVECVGPVAYRLKLPQELSCVHDTFHVSNLKKCLADPNVQVPLDEIEIDENLRFVEEPIEIVERDVKKLKRRRIPLVKVRWNSRQGAKYTWEHEDQFRKKYLHLFSETVPSSGVAT